MTKTLLEMNVGEKTTQLIENQMSSDHEIVMATVVPGGAPVPPSEPVLEVPAVTEAVTAPEPEVTAAPEAQTQTQDEVAVEAAPMG